MVSNPLAFLPYMEADLKVIQLNIMSSFNIKVCIVSYVKISKLIDYWNESCMGKMMSMTSLRSNDVTVD